MKKAILFFALIGAITSARSHAQVGVADQGVWPSSNPPSFVAGFTGNLSSTPSASISSSSFTMTSGDLVHVFCRAGQVGAAFTVADTLGNTFGAGSLNSFSDGADQGFWIINSLAGSDTITCSANGSVAFLGMQVDQFHPGFLTVPDSSANLVGNVAGPTGTVTSPAFSTTAKGLVFFCGDPAFASGGINGGLIAGLTGIIPSADVSIAQQCQYAISTSSLSGTASMSAATGTGNWGFVLDAFK